MRTIPTPDEVAPWNDAIPKRTPEARANVSNVIRFIMSPDKLPYYMMSYRVVALKCYTTS
ncbi:MAG: hypothetical protein IJE77_04540 [Thermoguttaceae bacterium]|nr:hypothetical protein [Thermoguttaceae bacterium]MBQ9801387.1 hypothetical protein [Thermoguttaceae bacterium]